MTSGDGSYSVSFVQMAEKVDELAKHGQTMESQLTELQSQVNTHLNPESWTSDAKNEWHQAQTVWKNTGEDMHRKIVAIQKALDNIYENYGMTENQAKSMWDSVGLSDDGSGIAR